MSSLEEDIGYIKGKLDTVQLENNRDHDEIKNVLTSGSDRMQLICEQINELHLTTSRHDVVIDSLDGRVGVIEKKQQYVDAIGHFIVAHPKLVISAMFAIVLLVAGISVDEIWKYVKG